MITANILTEWVKPLENNRYSSVTIPSWVTGSTYNSFVVPNENLDILPTRVTFLDMPDTPTFKAYVVLRLESEKEYEVKYSSREDTYNLKLPGNELATRVRNHFLRAMNAVHESTKDLCPVVFPASCIHPGMNERPKSITTKDGRTVETRAISIPPEGENDKWKTITLFGKDLQNIKASKSGSAVTVWLPAGKVLKASMRTEDGHFVSENLDWGKLSSLRKNNTKNKLQETR